MTGRFDAVQMIMADDEILPAHRVVQRMRARIAPMTVQIIDAQSGACAGQLKQLVGGKNSGFRRQNFRFRNREGGGRDGLLIPRQPGPCRYRSRGGIWCAHSRSSLRRHHFGMLILGFASRLLGVVDILPRKEERKR